MFGMYYPGNQKVAIGDILPFGQIKVQVLEIKGPLYWSVNSEPRYKLTVKKHLEVSK